LRHEFETAMFKVFSLIAAVCALPQATAPKTVTVTNNGLKYVPAELTVKVGDTVVFNVPRHDAVESATFGSCQAKTGGFNLNTGESKQFTKAGTYYYYCSVGRHCAQGMVATITVV
jgi:plastocyanin